MLGDQQSTSRIAEYGGGGVLIGDRSDHTRGASNYTQYPLHLVPAFAYANTISLIVQRVMTQIGESKPVVLCNCIILVVWRRGFPLAIMMIQRLERGGEHACCKLEKRMD
jgi:hypothetical protein